MADDPTKGLSGAEKRRRRKGGSSTGGPGKKGVFRQPIRSRRGYLAPTILERGAMAARHAEAARDG